MDIRTPEIELPEDLIDVVERVAANQGRSIMTTTMRLLTTRKPSYGRGDGAITWALFL